MNLNWLQKYALNLGWFLLLLGGISLLDCGIWSYAGILMVLVGLTNMFNSLRLLYLGKRTLLFNTGSMCLLNIAGLIVLSCGHVFTTKKEISWELLGFLAFSIVFLFIGKSNADDLAAPESKKTSAKR
ncbi:MAG: hypothetical protein FJY15_02045 [Bacteroidetes bacterium]|nr:hypothetical protein [Bacteroidota bacterium]